jgi:outer membrane protein TolC
MTAVSSFQTGRTGRAAALLAALPVWLVATAAAAQGLPTEALLRQALQQSPAADAATAEWRAGQAQAAQTRLGPNDWVLRAGIARRSERGGDVFAEREIGIERTLRWGAKAAQDAGLADQGLRLATLRRQAAWQDSADALLAQWFDARRDAQAAAHQRQQAQLAQAQVAALQRRVAAGDAAALLLRQAEGEAARTGAALAAAEQRAATSRQALLQQHPVLAAAWPGDGATPVESAANTANTADSDTAADASPAAVADRTTQVLARHPALAAARAELDLLRQQLRRLEADRQPDPTLGVRIAQERGGAERVLGLSVSLPFGPALRDSRVQAGSAALAAGEARLRALQQQAETEARRLAAAPDQAAQVLQRLQAAAAAAHTSATLTARAQAAGEATLAELLQQQRAAGDSALAADLAATDVQQARARLRLALQQWLAPPAGLP